MIFKRNTQLNFWLSENTTRIQIYRKKKHAQDKKIRSPRNYKKGLGEFALWVFKISLIKTHSFIKFSNWVINPNHTFTWLSIIDTPGMPGVLNALQLQLKLTWILAPLKFNVFFNCFFIDAYAAYEVARRPHYVFVPIHLGQPRKRFTHLWRRLAF